jgi:hypothetical protein
VRTAAALLLIASIAQAQPAGWELKLPDKLEVAAGQVGTLSLSIAVDRGLSISRDAGLIVDLAPEPGVTIKKRRLGRGDAVDPEADAPRFAVPVHADADAAIQVHVRFWLCAARTCKPVDVKRQVAVTVTQP